MTFSRHLLLLSLTFGSALLTTAAPLPRSTPEAQGISSSALSAMIDEAEQKALGLHSLIIVRHGSVVAEGWWAPYSAEEPHALYSLSKSFTSTAVGLAIAEGKFTLDDPILKFFPEDAPAEPSKNLQAMRVRDLLTMTTGQHGEDIDKIDFFSTERPATKQFLALPVPHKPGTFFYYNTAATYMLSALVQKVSGQTLLEYLQPRLFDPLGFEKPTWQTSPQGISLGGFGLSARTEELARFGQFYLQRGHWQGKRILPAKWIELATSRQVSNGSQPDSDWDQGYGFQFWRTRHGFYRGDGAFGQFCIVMPQHDAVVAITSGTPNMGAVMNWLWDKLLPALRPNALPEDESAASTLKQKLAALTIPPAGGAITSPIAAKVDGQTFTLSSNPVHLEAVTLQASSTGTTLVLRISGKDVSIPIGHNTWTPGPELSFGPSLSPTASSGGWTADDTFTVFTCFYRSPFISTSKLQFKEGKLNYDLGANLGSGSEATMHLDGTPK